MSRAFTLFLILLFAGCTDLNEQTRSLVAEVRNKHVPDRRTEIFNVEVIAGEEKSVVLKGETTLQEAKDELHKMLDEKNTRYIDSITVLPDTVPDGRFFALATVSVINLRKEPDHSAELVSQSLLGTPVLILRKDGYWMQVRTPDRYISWTESSSLREISRKELEQWNSSERLIFIENTGWIYDSTSESGVVGDLVAGCIVAKTGETGDHVRIMLPDGREGYVRRQQLSRFSETMNKASLEEGIIKTAESFTGIPYLWGGSSVKGADCSGFVQNVYFLNGLLLTRDASQQALYGKSVDISRDFSNLQPGDLLFFGTPERISHVAIYKGDTEYIHSSGRVMINSLDSTRKNYSPYRRSSLVKASRMLGVNDSGIIPVTRHSWY